MTAVVAHGGGGGHGGDHGGGYLPLGSVTQTFLVKNPDLSCKE